MLLSEARRAQRPWDAWLETWAHHASTDRFQRLVDRAARTVHDAALAGRYFAGCSGGKDSVAVAALLDHAHVTTVPLWHVSTPIDIPEMRSLVEAIAEQLDFDLDIIEPDFGEGVTAWDFLRALPRDMPIWEEALHGLWRAKAASGNMLVAYLYERRQDIDGAIAGLRADESKGRLWNFRVRGDWYQNQTDGTYMCCPIADWTSRDAYAMAVHADLPIHPHYRLMWEHFALDPESPHARVDCVIPEDRVTSWSARDVCEALYPTLWRELVSVRPELASQQSGAPVRW